MYPRRDYEDTCSLDLGIPVYDLSAYWGTLGVHGGFCLARVAER